MPAAGCRKNPKTGQDSNPRTLRSREKNEKKVMARRGIDLGTFGLQKQSFATELPVIVTEKQ